jgi:hypothetical protein
MKKPRKHFSPPKVNNSTRKDLNDSEADKMFNNEFTKTMLRRISEIKQYMYKHLNEF